MQRIWGSFFYKNVLYKFTVIIIIIIIIITLSLSTLLLFFAYQHKVAGTETKQGVIWLQHRLI